MSESTRYIFSQGVLSRKDNSLCFRKDGKNVYIPIEGVKELYVLNEVTLNTKLLDFLASNGVIVHFFNYFGNYSGTYYPRIKYISGRIKVKQVELFMRKREEIAKNIVFAIRKNIIHLLQNRYKNGNSNIKPHLDYIKNEIPYLIENAQTINEILSVEGAIWNRFYDSFKYILKEEFMFNKRVKRPPDNPINALISFGNSILYSKVITQLYYTHLDQSVSFLHEPSESRFSLSLDLSETFKLAIIYPIIFNMVNKNMIKVELHFEKKLNYCYLNEEGRKIFLLELEKKLNSTFKHPQLNRKVSYLNAIKLDGYKLIKCVMEDKPFVPFLMEEMV